MTRVANSLETLLHQINARFPDRSIASDGGVGDAAHQNKGKASDHNPWYGPGIVTARDFTHDPAHGLNIQEISDQLLASRDPRIKYVIANGRIATNRDWQWAPYDGANPHDKHFHISVVADPRCDEAHPWDLPILGGGGGNGGGAEPGMFVTRGTDVNIRAEPHQGAAVVTVLAGPTRVRVGCQTRGGVVETEGRSNSAWSHLPDFGGYISNIFIDHPAAWLPDVGEC